MSIVEGLNRPGWKAPSGWSVASVVVVCAESVCVCRRDVSDATSRDRQFDRLLRGGRQADRRHPMRAGCRSRQLTHLPGKYAPSQWSTW